MNSWSTKMRSTKAELLHLKSLVYGKILRPSNSEELSQSKGCILPTVTCIWKSTKTQGNILDGMSTSCILYKRLLFENKASSNFWYMTWGAMFGVLCTTRAVASRARKLKVCSTLLAIMLCGSSAGKSTIKLYCFTMFSSWHLDFLLQYSEYQKSLQ